MPTMYCPYALSSSGNAIDLFSTFSSSLNVSVVREAASDVNSFKDSDDGADAYNPVFGQIPLLQNLV